MQISNHNPLHDKTAGFSLLEVLVVLAIMGLILSVVSIRLTRTVESAYFSRTADAAIASLLVLRADAVLKKENRTLITDTSRKKDDLEKENIRRLDLPEGWKVSGEAINISRTGTCFGGDIILSDNKGRQAVYKLIPPKCKAIRYVALEG